MTSSTRSRWTSGGLALLLLLAPWGPALSDDVDNMEGLQINGANVFATQNSLSGSGSQSSLVGGSANTGSGEQSHMSNDSSVWDDIGNANAGSGSQFTDSENSNGGDRNSSDVVLELGGSAALTVSDLGTTVTGNMVDVKVGTVDSSLSLAGSDSGFSGLYGVNAVAASAGSQATQNVSVNVGAEVVSY